MATLRFFIPTHWRECIKNKKTKAKSLDSVEPSLLGGVEKVLTDRAKPFSPCRAPQQPLPLKGGVKFTALLL